MKKWFKKIGQSFLRKDEKQEIKEIPPAVEQEEIKDKEAIPPAVEQEEIKEAKKLSLLLLNKKK